MKVGECRIELSFYFLLHDDQMMWNDGWWELNSALFLPIHKKKRKKRKKKKKKSVALTFCCTSCWQPVLKLIDVAKWAGWVGLIRLRVDRVTSWVELTRIFQTNFFFFEIDVICQLFMSSLIVIRFSLVILLPITTKHLIPKFRATLVLTF